MKIGIIILNYVNYKILFECVESLKKQEGFDECDIAIVDNNSPNDSVSQIIAYLNCPNIHFLKSKNNVGYAQGNNIGFDFLKSTCKCETIIVANSDIILENETFLSEIKKAIHRYENYQIIAPDVINPLGIHSNPFGLSFISKKNISKIIFRTKLSYLCLKIGLDLTIFKGKKINNVITESDHPYDDYFVPHGSCIIFTPSWTSSEDRCFFPGTFLFCEENFLVSYIVAKNYKMIYEPSLQILHKEDGSIDATSKTIRKKKLFVRKCQLESLKKYRSFLKNPLDSWSKDNPYDDKNVEMVSQ